MLFDICLKKSIVVNVSYFWNKHILLRYADQILSGDEMLALGIEELTPVKVIKTSILTKQGKNPFAQIGCMCYSLNLPYISKQAVI